LKTDLKALVNTSTPAGKKVATANCWLPTASYGVLLFLLLPVLGGFPLSTAIAHASDPAEPGPFAVTREEYNFGNTAFTPSGFPAPVELIASVHYPTGLSGGPFPLVIFLHGRHRTCYDGVSAVYEWPCSGSRKPIPSYQGFDYISQVLASHGYIVVSISANGIAVHDAETSDFGMLARAQLIQAHLDIWNSFNSSGGSPFGTKFVGKVDLNNVGTMGHSAGGEGVARHFLHNQSLGSPYGVKAVFPVVPGNNLRLLLNNVPLGLLLSYCDGIATSLPGVHYFDDARYSVANDPAAKHMIVVMGANHNYYNSVWTPPSTLAPAVDDWSAFITGGSLDPHCGGVAGNKRLTGAQQQAAGLVYVAGFFRLYLGGETGFLPLFQGDVPPPPSAMTSDTRTSYHAPDDPALRRDVNQLLDATDLTTNTLGGAAAQSGFTPYDLCGGESPEPQHCAPTQPTTRQPHTAPSALSSARGLSQLRGGWSTPGALYSNDLPVGFRDVSGFQVLQFRAGVNFADSRNPVGQAQDFRVELIDGTGAAVSALVSDWSPALFYPPGSIGPVPKILLNTVRMPLAAFSGVNLADIRSVRFKFDQRAKGALLISDLAFADVAIPNGNPISYAHIFSCGASAFSQTTIAITNRGNVARFSSPGAQDEIITAALRSGYQVCYATGAGGPFFTSYDFGETQSGWSAGVNIFQPNGPNTFPLEITRTTADGRSRVTRRFTGNSFIASVPLGNSLDLNSDGQACSSLGECGNCTNRTLHVLTKVENLTSGNLFNVSVVELADFDIDGSNGGDRFIRTADSVLAYEDLSDGAGGPKGGMLLQGLVTPVVPAVLASGTYGAAADCAIASTATPAGPGSFEAIVRQDFGTLVPGANTGNNIRTHYRRF